MAEYFQQEEEKYPNEFERKKNRQIRKKRCNLPFSVQQKPSVGTEVKSRHHPRNISNSVYFSEILFRTDTIGYSDKRRPSEKLGHVHMIMLPGQPRAFKLNKQCDRLIESRFELLCSTVCSRLFRKTMSRWA